MEPPEKNKNNKSTTTKINNNKIQCLCQRKNNNNNRQQQQTITDNNNKNYRAIYADALYLQYMLALEIGSDGDRRKGAIGISKAEEAKVLWPPLSFYRVSIALNALNIAF